MKYIGDARNKGGWDVEIHLRVRDSTIGELLHGIRKYYGLPQTLFLGEGIVIALAGVGGLPFAVRTVEIDNVTYTTGNVGGTQSAEGEQVTLAEKIIVNGTRRQDDRPRHDRGDR